MIPTADTPDAFGDTVFCDDIRTEVGGKFSLVGVYPSGLQVPAFPITFPKFGFCASFWQRREAFKGQLSLRIYFPGDEDEKPSVEAQLDADNVPEGVAKGPPYIVMRANIVLTGMVLNGPGSLKSRVLREGILVPIGSLPILQAPKPPPTESTSETE